MYKVNDFACGSAAATTEVLPHRQAVRQAGQLPHVTHLILLRKSATARGPKIIACRTCGGAAAPFKGLQLCRAALTHDEQSSSSGINSIPPGRLRVRVRSWAETASPIPGGAP
jgi:hypothetical protein